MIGGNWIKSLSLNTNAHNKHFKHDCAMTAVVCNCTTLLHQEESAVDEETRWLISTAKDHPDGYGCLYYHDKDYKKHSHQILNTNPNAENPDYLNHLIKSTKSLSHHLPFDSFIAKAKQSAAKILLAYTVKRHQTDNKHAPEPLLFHDPARHVTYSMLHHGSLDKDDLLMRLPGFVDWLNIHRHDMLDKELFDDSEFLFMWLIKNINAYEGDVNNGLQNALSIINKNGISGQLNILFSDGSGVYAFTNQNKSDSGLNIDISYKINRNVKNICSYVIRSSKTNPGLGWISLKERSLYYFPSYGAMLVFMDIDKAQNSELKFKPGYNWVTFSLMTA
jgi:hypothetical protein